MATTEGYSCSEEKMTELLVRLALVSELRPRSSLLSGSRSSSPPSPSSPLQPGWLTRSLVGWATCTQRSREVAANRRSLIGTLSPETSLSGRTEREHWANWFLFSTCFRNDGTAVIADFGLAVRYRDENNSLDISPNTRWLSLLIVDESWR